MHSVYRFRMYVAGNSPNSTRAVANLQALCQKFAPDRHQIEIVDAFREPMRALNDGVLLTPTLVRVAPPPVRTIVGDLSDDAVISSIFALHK